MTATTDVAMMLLQLVALTIPSVVVLIQMLRRSENLPWRLRKVSFALVLSSIVLLLGGAIALLAYFALALSLPLTMYVALGLVFAGLCPFTAFMAVLYREHRAEFGP
ncbi:MULTISPECIES: hypothetical protein [Saliphagus]|uniref:Uncharacterized protein n=1 Tax=Saliphagus infecundisoli TaxID=1849069 RepID=A0ABD5QKY5_9EURY|nr:MULTISPECIES: hypothetical protein [Saliphagus]